MSSFESSFPACPHTRYLSFNGAELQRPPFEHKPSPRVQGIEQTQRGAQNDLEIKKKRKWACQRYRGECC